MSLSPLQSLTPAQRHELIALIDECRALGATTPALGPLYGALGIFSSDERALMFDETLYDDPVDIIIDSPRHHFYD